MGVSLDDPVGVPEIAKRLRRDEHTIACWVKYEDFPPARWPRVNGLPAWTMRDIVRWKRAKMKIRIHKEMTEL